MATRAFIGMVKGDEYHHIYCHFDGHVGGVGKILQEHYRTEEKVQALINLGSALFGTHIGASGSRSTVWVGVVI